MQMTYIVFRNKKKKKKKKRKKTPYADILFCLVYELDNE